MTIKTIKIELPVHWASALINGDVSGLEDDDLEVLYKFEAYMLNEHGSCLCVDVGEEVSFQKYHEAAFFGGLACDAATFSFQVD